MVAGLGLPSNGATAARDEQKLNSHCDLTWVRLQLERMGFCLSIITFISLITRLCIRVLVFGTLLCLPNSAVVPVLCSCPVFKSLFSFLLILFFW